MKLKKKMDKAHRVTKTLKLLLGYMGFSETGNSFPISYKLKVY